MSKIVDFYVIIMTYKFILFKIPFRTVFNIQKNTYRKLFSEKCYQISNLLDIGDLYQIANDLTK